MGMKTAYIELNTTNQIYFLAQNGETSVFSYKGITVFPSVKVTSLSEIFSMNYDYYVIDMSVINTYLAREFAKCDYQFLVGSLCEWKMQSTMEKIEHLFQLTNLSQESVTVLSNFGIKKSKVLSFFQNNFKVVTFPFIQNPFQLQPKEFAIFTKLLERNISIPKKNFKLSE